VSFAYTGAAVPIPDASAVGASVQIPVSGFGWASKIGFSIGGTTCDTTAGSTTVGIDHTYVGDMVGQLISPSGAVATVFNGNGGGGNNMCQVVFDDGADAAFSSVGAANAPYTGKWRPASPLNALRATPADGTWTFFVQDTANQDTGTIRDVSLQLYGYVSAS
jgi:subtilisin-like proprotein convertase family protein